MIAYNNEWLDHMYVHQQLEEACEQNLMSREEMENTKKNYPAGFYTPHFFVGLGLFLLTVVIVLFSFGFFMLVLNFPGSDQVLGACCIVFGILTWVALELMVRKRHFRSGVDTALLWMSAIFIIVGANLIFNLSKTGNAGLIFVVCLFGVLRFVDALMGALACLSILALLFLEYIKLGAFAKATIPLLLMLASAGIYFLTKGRQMLRSSRRYASCLLLVETTALLCLYVSVNYYAVRETSNEMFRLNLKEDESIPFGWLFWILTIIVPISYLVRGIQKKDAVLIRVGLVLTAATVMTIRYYYHVIPVETALLIGGIVLIVTAYALIRYLKKPRYGFTAAEISKLQADGKRQAESLLIAGMTGAQHQSPSGGTHFGGGTGTGGGAGGTY